MTAATPYYRVPDDHVHPDLSTSPRYPDPPPGPSPQSPDPRTNAPLHNLVAAATKAATQGPSTPPRSRPGKRKRDPPTAAATPPSALFRTPPAPDAAPHRKPTRPAMATLYASFAPLGPEAFLALQADAKAFMLDDGAPERRACVGVRGRTDGAGVRLGLVRCAERFLGEGGAGARHFGATAAVGGTGEGGMLAGIHDVAGGGGGLAWPRDRERLVQLCMPLLRRVVTNEKQRQYAVETRKAGKEVKAEQGNGTGGAAAEEGLSVDMFLVDADNESRLLHRKGLLLDAARGQWDRIQEMVGEEEQDWVVHSVRTLTAGGLVLVGDDKAFDAAVAGVYGAPWLEGKVRIVVAVERRAVR